MREADSICLPLFFINKLKRNNMSVVRKYQPGGVTPDPNKYSDYGEFIAKKLDEQKLTSKAGREILPTVQSWLELAKSGLLESAYKSDSINYTVDKNILPEHLRNIDFEGSRDGITSNIFGQISARPDKSNKGEEGDLTNRKFNTLIANWTNEYLKGKNQQAQQTTSKTDNQPKLKIQDQNEYIAKTMYGGNENYQDMWTKKIQSIADPIERQKYIMSITPKVFDLYNTNKGVHSGYTPVENEALIREAIATGNWDQYLQETRKLGWNPEELLMSKSEEELKAEKEKQNQERLKLFGEDLLGKGYSADIVSQLIEGGYTNLVENNAWSEGPDWLKEDINKNALVLANDKGKQIVINKKGPWEKAYESPLHPGYRSYFQYDGSTPTLYTPGMEGYDESKFRDDVQGVTYAGLEGQVEGYQDWKMLGVPTMTDKGLIYHHNIILTNPVTNEKVELKLTPNGYINVKTGQPAKVNIDRISKGIPDTPPLDYLKFKGEGALFAGDEFANLRARPTEDLQAVLNTARSLLKSDIDRNTHAKISQLLPKLRYVISSAPNTLDREEAYKLYTQIHEMSKSSENLVRDVKSNFDPNKNNFWKFMLRHSAPGVNSGIRGLKEVGWLQKGGVLSREDYLAKYVTPTQVEQEKPIERKDIRGTLADASPEQIASMIGAGMSILPGVGAIGATVTTLADLKEDLKDGKIDDKWNHFINLGFVGLSAVGLGGLRAAKLGLDIAKTTGKTAQLAKVITKSDDIKDLASAVTKITKVDGKLPYSAAKLTDSEFKLLKSAGIVNPKANINTIAKKGTSDKMLQLLKKSKETGLTPAVRPSGLKPFELVKQHAPKRPSALEREFSGTINLFNKLKSPDLSSVSKYGLMGLKGAGLATGAFSAAKVGIGAATDGVEGVQVQDAKNTLYALGGLRGYIKSRQLVNQAQHIKKASGKAKFIVGDKKFDVDEAITVPALKKPGGIKGKVTGKLSDEDVKFNEKTLEEFRKTLSDKLGDKLPKDIDELLKQKDLTKVFRNQDAALDQIIEFKDLPKDSPIKFKEDYNRVKALLEGKINSYFTPDWLTKHKKGGVLKAQRGTNQGFWSSITPSKERRKANTWNSILFGPLSAITDAVKTAEDIAPRAYNYFTNKNTNINVPINNSVYRPSFYGLESTGGPRKINPVIETKINPVIETETETEIPVIPEINPSTIASPTYTFNRGFKLTPEKEEDLSWVKLTSNKINNKVNTKPNSSFIRKRTFQDYFDKVNIDSKDLLNTAQYLRLLKTNQLSAEAQKRAALAGVTRFPSVPQQYLRTTSPTSAFYDKQASRISTLGKNLAGTTSDIDKGFNARLSSEIQGIGLREKGILSDQQQIEQRIAQQDQSNRQTQLANLEVDAKNRLSTSGALRDINLIDSNKLVANQEAFKGYSTTMSALQDYKRQKQMDKDFYNFATKGTAQGLQNEYTQLKKEMDQAKKDFVQNAPGANVDSLWENSGKKAEYEEKMKNLEDRLRTYQLETQNWGMRRQLGITKAKKGMSIEERKELMRYKHQITKSEKELERLYKYILKNNELMQKSLFKLFK